MAMSALGFGAAADAQSGIPASLSDTARQQAVSARARPDYEPAGIPAGGFRIYPSVPVQLTYDDNVFNSDVQEVRDVSARVLPRAVARSNWGRHALTLTAGGRFERFAKRKTENNDQYDVGAKGSST